MVVSLVGKGRARGGIQAWANDDGGMSDIMTGHVRNLYLRCSPSFIPPLPVRCFLPLLLQWPRGATVSPGGDSFGSDPNHSTPLSFSLSPNIDPDCRPRLSSASAEFYCRLEDNRVNLWTLVPSKSSSAAIDKPSLLGFKRTCARWGHPEVRRLFPRPYILCSFRRCRRVSRRCASPLPASNLFWNQNQNRGRRMANRIPSDSENRSTTTAGGFCQATTEARGGKNGRNGCGGPNAKGKGRVPAAPSSVGGHACSWRRLRQSFSSTSIYSSFSYSPTTGL